MSAPLIILPNMLSVFRLFSALFIVVFIQRHLFFEALVLFICAALSDFLDGFLARTLKQESPLGAYLDPIADKVLLISTFIALSYQGKIPLWLTGLMIARDGQIILGVLALHLMKRSFKISPLFISKVNTVFQMLLILICLGGFSNQNLLYSLILYGTALTTLLSSGAYMLLWRKSIYYP